MVRFPTSNPNDPSIFTRWDIGGRLHSVWRTVRMGRCHSFGRYPIICKLAFRGFEYPTWACNIVSGSSEYCMWGRFRSFSPLREHACSAHTEIAAHYGISVRGMSHLGGDVVCARAGLSIPHFNIFSWLRLFPPARFGSLFLGLFAFRW